MRLQPLREIGEYWEVLNAQSPKVLSFSQWHSQQFFATAIAAINVRAIILLTELNIFSTLHTLVMYNFILASGSIFARVVLKDTAYYRIKSVSFTFIFQRKNWGSKGLDISLVPLSLVHPCKMKQNSSTTTIIILFRKLIPEFWEYQKQSRYYMWNLCKETELRSDQ